MVGFIKWCKGQKENRFGWLGAAITAQGCIATPLTLFAVVLPSSIFIFWILAITAMGFHINAVLAQTV